MGCAGSKEASGPAPGAVQFAQAGALETPLVKTAEQLTAEAELTELRRLTPKQQAAAAKAAQRIEEVAAAAEAAPKKERAAPALSDGRELWAVYGGGTIESLLDHTPLIDLEYMAGGRSPSTGARRATRGTRGRASSSSLMLSFGLGLGREGPR